LPVTVADVENMGRWVDSVGHVRAITSAVTNEY
jgi:hypothetical protein